MATSYLDIFDNVDQNQCLVTETDCQILDFTCTAPPSLVYVTFTISPFLLQAPETIFEGYKE